MIQYLEERVNCKNIVKFAEKYMYTDRDNTVIINKLIYILNNLKKLKDYMLHAGLEPASQGLQNPRSTY